MQSEPKKKEGYRWRGRGRNTHPPRLSPVQPEELMELGAAYRWLAEHGARVQFLRSERRVGGRRSQVVHLELWVPCGQSGEVSEYFCSINLNEQLDSPLGLQYLVTRAARYIENL